MPESRPSSRAERGAAWTAAVLGVAVVLVAIAFAGARHGEFVYDDGKQIGSNPLIQDPANFGKALVSDVWGFDGGAGGPRSRYWRPAFVAWCMAGWALFGAEPAGWHLASAALHLIVTILAFFSLRAVGARPATAAAASWIFAAHPVHVESVAWISGAPDLLAAAFLLGAHLAHLAARRGPEGGGRLVAVALFGGALLSKEPSIVFPAVVLVTEWALGARGGRPFRAAAPYAAAAGVYLAARFAVLGAHREEIPGALDLSATLASAPGVLVFYLGQIVAPHALAPSYAWTPVTFEPAGIASFALPVALVALVGAGALAAARRSAVCAIALAWLVLPLLPALDLRNFLAEDLLHDRYLYLSVLGAAALVASLAVDAWDRWARAGMRGGVVVAGLLALPAALAGALAARSYTDVWRSDVTLWERAVARNPDAAFTRAQLGEAYRRAGRREEARRELAIALERSPGIKAAHESLGALSVQEGRYEDAERHLRAVLAERPGERVALEQLALALQKQGRIDEALALFERGRALLPTRAAAYAVNIAVLHRTAGRAREAEAALRSLGPALDRSRDPAVLRAWWYLGELERERGDRAAALASYDRYLVATASLRDPGVAALRDVVTSQRRAVAGVP